MAKLKTGRHTSALKQVRQSDRRNSRNSGIKKVIKATAKEFIKSLDGSDVEASDKLLRDVYSKWDKAVKKGTVHWKKAARKKSQLAKLAKKKSA